MGGAVDFEQSKGLRFLSERSRFELFEDDKEDEDDVDGTPLRKAKGIFLRSDELPK